MAKYGKKNNKSGMRNTEQIIQNGKTIQFIIKLFELVNQTFPNYFSPSAHWYPFTAFHTAFALPPFREREREKDD